MNPPLVPSSALHPARYLVSVQRGRRWLFSIVPCGIAVGTRRSDVDGRVLAAFAARDQVLCCALQTRVAGTFGLASWQLKWRGEPHEHATVHAVAVLAFESLATKDLNL